ncbi:HD-GYP domain-containing protein [Thalassotalea sp. 1_MG-2023]|uniref:HD-GYP domain-containing protein n=1 Tax=Thalassotalea sp. 1_MG-2023 TaxID=3062680 RepID=UPI0026E3F542|nr:HD-GYP domain-containing protein [Thalassotalea sp. 1_MG-2023]MDO6426274.1 HD-GYP domain-containing protein [Thalassotalea sp. 1_MG-2023]
MIKQICISELKVGHFVVSIAKQSAQYTLTSAGHIKSDRVIQNLSNKGVQQVIIDTDKTLTFAQDQAAIAQETVNKRVTIQAKDAKEIFSVSKEIQQKVFNDAAQGRPLDLSPVTEITDKVIEEIFKNSNALASIINIRNKDEYLLEHSISVSILITIFAKFLKLDKNIIQQLAIGAFLHDVGKIMIPEEVLNKPGRLTEDEFSIMKSHVTHSIDIIQHTPGISELSLEVAALHHEKLNGQGYPFNIPGDHISTYGRMIAICDIFDALTAARCYKDGYSHGKAFAILKNLAEQQHLDASLVTKFIQCMGVYPVGTLVELNSGKIAIVEEKNAKDLLNPKVKIFYSAKHHHFVETKYVDLSQSEDFIVKGIKADDLDLDMHQIIEQLITEG